METPHQVYMRVQEEMHPRMNNYTLPDDYELKAMQEYAEAYHAQFTPVGEDVEQACKAFQDKHNFRLRELTELDLFKAGAQWQASQQSSGEVDNLIHVLKQARSGYVNLLDFELLKGNYRSDTEDLIDKIDAALKPSSLHTQQDKSGWVKCSDRLPPEFDAVLVYTLHGNTTVGNTCYGSTKWNLNSGEPFRLSFVTHWMPLPFNPSIQ